MPIGTIRAVRPYQRCRRVRPELLPRTEPPCAGRRRDDRVKTVGVGCAELLPSRRDLLNEDGRPADGAALFAPLIWQPTARLPSQNLLSFCSLLARGCACKDRAGRTGLVTGFQDRNAIWARTASAPARQGVNKSDA